MDGTAAFTQSHCRECGYDRHGLPAGGACPECGHVPVANAIDIPATTAWRAMVCIGLWLMLLLTLHAVASVLVQRDWGHMLGTLPALNVAGPKLWAVPLLQRPTGNTPQTPGIIGTRTAMLGLLAVWLITARRHHEREQGTDLLRFSTRWTSVILFGAAFGLLTSQQGLWPNQLLIYRLVLVAGVELPATTLLYFYLRRLCDAVPGRHRREMFSRLVLLIPVTLIACAVVLLADWMLIGADRQRLDNSPLSLGAAIAIGIASMVTGIAATTAVGSLAGAMTLQAFPNAWRLLTGLRRHLGGSVRSLRRLDEPAHNDRRRLACAAAGLLLLVIVMLNGIDATGWFTARLGLGGNLPFYNYPGPKVWAATAMPELAGRYSWEPIVSRTLLLALNLAALWLITAVPLTGRRGPLLRRAVRWVPVLLLGAALGAASVMRRGDFSNYLAGPWRSEFFAIITLACELPATFLLYLYLRRLSVEHAWPKLGRGFAALGGVMIALVAVAISAFALSGQLLALRSSPVLAALSGVYGAAILCIAVWAVGLVLGLAWRLLGAATANDRYDASRGQAHEN